MATLLIFLILAAPSSDTVRVARVIDGDTFVTADSVRVIGVNTPELRSRDSTERKKARGAKAYLDSLICGKTVRLEYDSLSGKKDFFRRTLAYV